MIRNRADSAYLPVLTAAALAVSVSISHAGPCSPEIESTQTLIDAELNAYASVGPGAAEGTRATTHRQPTPRSVAAAEAQLGQISAQAIEAGTQAIARARAADQVGDKSACEQALAEVQRLIGR
jgi:hypothetical protein